MANTEEVYVKYDTFFSFVGIIIYTSSLSTQADNALV